MYKVTYKNGKEQLIPNQKGERFLLLQKQNMLSSRQKEWYQTVKSIDKLRDTIDHKTLMKTKDMKCSCHICY